MPMDSFADNQRADQSDLERELALALQENDLDKIAVSLSALGSLYYQQGKVEEAISYLEQALDLYQQLGAPAYNFAQALALYKQIGNRQDVAKTLTGLALMYEKTGQLQQALELLEQALPIYRDVGNREDEAKTLSRMGRIYLSIDQQQARPFYEQALPILREIGDQEGEVTALNNLAVMYHGEGQSRRAIVLMEEALSLYQIMGDRKGEALTITNMAAIYLNMGKSYLALKLYKQALPILHDLDDRADEATILTYTAKIYSNIGQWQQALALLQQALEIRRTVGDRAGAAQIMQYMAAEYSHTGQPQRAATLMEALIGLKFPYMGGDEHERLPDAYVRQIITKTIAVMTGADDSFDEWRKTIEQEHEQARQQKDSGMRELDFFSAILSSLDGKATAISTENPYAYAIEAIQEGIAVNRQQAFGVSDMMIKAVSDFVNARDGDETQEVVEVWQDLLFRPEIEALFEENIAQAQASKDERTARVLELHLSILHECKTRGIASTFERIKAAQQAAE